MALTTKQTLAAHRVAEGLATKDAIARELGVNRTTVYEWLKLAEFQALVREQACAILEASKAYGVASIAAQLMRMDLHYRALLQVIEERAVAGGKGPGSGTGLVLETVKNGVPVYEVDVSLLAEIRAIEQEARKVTGQESTRMSFGFEKLTDEELLKKAAPMIEKIRAMSG